MDSPLFQKREEAVGEVALGSIDAPSLGGRKESPCDVQLGNGKLGMVSAANQPQSRKRRAKAANRAYPACPSCTSLEHK